MQGAFITRMKAALGLVKPNNAVAHVLKGGRGLGHQEEKSANKGRENHSQDLNSEEEREAQLLFNNPQDIESNREMEQKEAEQPMKPKSILKQDKMMVEESDKPLKNVSFHDEGRPIYLMPIQKKWKDEIKDQKKGVFSSVEQKLLCDAVGQFLVTNEIQFDQFRKMISEGSNGILRRQKFFKILSTVLPNRSPQSCYKYILRQFNDNNHQGAWTLEEVEQLLGLVDKYGRKWKTIGKELKRTAGNVYDKYRSLGQEAHQQRVRKIWKLNQLIILLSQIQNEGKIEFLDPKVKTVMQKEQEHDALEMKQLQNHKYNTKYFVFHNIEILRPFIDAKTMKSVDLEKIRWKKVVRKIPSKSNFDCRNKFMQILQVVFKNNQGLDDILLEFLQRQKASDELSLNWRKWTSKEFTAEEARNRLMILKKLIEGRSKKDFGTIVHEIRRKVGRRMMEE